ncbi:MAG TPA: J domain-containing protein [Candidatus Limnocylindrales bacterium]|nr:J domain-containing protein [Candidatus Limnocylindrales bacterium]
MEYQDYYKTLGVKRDASTAEIKKAFRKLARELHPDRNPGDKAAEKRFKDVNEAHAVLSDPEKRRQYDALGADWERFARAGGGAGGADPFGPGGPFAGFGGAGRGQAGNVRYEFRTTGGDTGGFSDFFRMFFGGEQPGGGTATRTRTRSGTSTGSIDDILEQLQRDAATGGGGTAGQGAGNGRAARHEIEAPTELTLEEAYHGTTRIVDVEGKRYEVTIPRGTDSGSRIRLSGKGPGGRDVVVAVRVKPHPVFTRRGADLERELPITLEEALLGAEVPVGTLKGRVLLTIPPGTQSGRSFRLTGQGMPRLRQDGFGDLYVKVRVVLPGQLSDEAQGAARRLFELVDQPNPRTSA